MLFILCSSFSCSEDIGPFPLRLVVDAIDLRSNEMTKISKKLELGPSFKRQSVGVKFETTMIHTSKSDVAINNEYLVGKSNQKDNKQEDFK